MERLCETQNPDIHNVNITTKEFQNISLKALSLQSL